jgi:hypothetical protein
MKKFAAIAVLICMMAIAAVAQVGQISSTNGVTVQQYAYSTPVYRVINTNSTYAKVRFTQPSYAVTIYLAPGESRSVGNFEGFWFWACAQGGSPTVQGTFNQEPDYSNKGQNMDCR